MSNKIQRNSPCPCESGRKFKRCCGDEAVLVRKSQEIMEQARQNWMKRQVEIANQPKQTVVGTIAPKSLLAAALLLAATQYTHVQAQLEPKQYGKSNYLCGRKRRRQGEGEGL